MTTTTILLRKDGKTAEHIGTSGLTITATRDGGEDVEVFAEYDDASPEELKMMVVALLIDLDEKHGENFIAQCLSHYALDTKKRCNRIGDRNLVMLHGHADRPLSKREQ